MGQGHSIPMAGVTVVAFILLSLFPSRTAFLETGETAPQPLTAERRIAFLASIEGPWVGRARVTPLGPRPYDMTFVRTAPMRLEGQAYPGASTHFWTFYEEDETLKLRFLSTFAGNQQPLWLAATVEHAGALVFHTPQPHFLEVHVRPHAQSLALLIFLRGTPHVEIALTRSE
jgi:hypothetical protein